MKCNQSGPGFELVSPCPYPATITITPREGDSYPYLAMSSQCLSSLLLLEPIFDSVLSYRDLTVPLLVFGGFSFSSLF